MFRRTTSQIDRPRVPPGYRAYAVGDIHGRVDLLDQLLSLIEQDVARDPASRSLLIFLGDMIDRGPESKRVVERLRSYDHPRLQPYFIAGNHEEVLLRLLAGEKGVLSGWLKYGGGECLRSYGVDPKSLASLDERSALAAVKKAIPVSHAQFIASFIDTLRFGDYLFVHAGIRPGVDLSLQSQTDLRWIRSPFLESERHHGLVVVHGHTISESVDDRGNRIGIDTGAYRTDVLTALVMEGDRRWIIDTGIEQARRAAV